MFTIQSICALRFTSSALMVVRLPIASCRAFHAVSKSVLPDCITHENWLGSSEAVMSCSPCSTVATRAICPCPLCIMLPPLSDRICTV